MTKEQKVMIEELYFSLFEMLLRYAASSLQNEALAQEAVQETFRIACTRPESVCDSLNPKGWILNTLKYVLSNMERRQNVANRIVTQYLDDLPEHLGSVSDPLDPDLVYSDVADTEEFRLMKAIALEGKSMLEIALEKGITVDACKKRVQRAREKLQQKIFR